MLLSKANYKWGTKTSKYCIYQSLHRVVLYGPKGRVWDRGDVVSKAWLIITDHPPVSGRLSFEQPLYVDADVVFCWRSGWDDENVCLEEV